jgi:hypothetical protein
MIIFSIVLRSHEVGRGIFMWFDYQFGPAKLGQDD